MSSVHVPRPHSDPPPANSFPRTAWVELSMALARVQVCGYCNLLYVDQYPEGIRGSVGRGAGVCG